MVSKNIGGTLVAGPTGGGVVLYTGRKVLLQKRDHQPERYPGYLALFGGQIESDESPEEAAVREVKEELGLDLDIGSLRPLGTIEVLREGYNATLLFFTAPLLVDLGELKLGEGDGFAGSAPLSPIAPSLTEGAIPIVKQPNPGAGLWCLHGRQKSMSNGGGLGPSRLGFDRP